MLLYIVEKENKCKNINPIPFAGHPHINAMGTICSCHRVDGIPLPRNALPLQINPMEEYVLHFIYNFFLVPCFSVISSGGYAKDSLENRLFDGFSCGPCYPYSPLFAIFSIK